MMYFNIQTSNQVVKLSVELTLFQKGIIAIFGPSGVGKSSFFNAIVDKNNNPDHEIMIKGIYWKKRGKPLSLEKRKVVLVKQNPILFSHLSIEKNMRYGFKRIKPRRSEYFFEDVIEKFNITPLLKKYPSQLSGGEIQRAAIAQALLANPQLLLLDEAFSGLDEDQKLVIMKNLKAHILSENMEMMYITHSKDEVFSLADHVALMRDGKIEQVINCRDFMMQSNKINQPISIMKEEIA